MANTEVCCVLQAKYEAADCFGNLIVRVVVCKIWFKTWGFHGDKDSGHDLLHYDAM